MTVLGIAVFPDAALLALAALALIYFCSYFIKGAFGFGSLTPAIMFGSWLIAPHHAVLLATLANAASQVQFVPEGLRHGDRALTLRVLPANFLGAVLGLAIFATIDPRLLSLALGLCLGLLVAAEMARVPERIGALVDLAGWKATTTMAALSGLISGVTGAGGLFFMVAIIKVAVPEPRAFRATTLLVSAVVVLFRTAILVGSGFVTPSLLVETLLLTPAILLGGWIGARFFRLLPARLFFAGIQALLLLGAAGLIWQGWPR